jgi:hypothetical protein
MKFRRGLSSAIQDKIAELGIDRPTDDDINGWYSAARRFDRNRLANEAFHSAKPPAFASTPATSIPGRSFFNRPPLPPATSKPLSMGVPMDIDAQRSQSSLPIICHRCGKPGHIAPKCPLRFDVRHMTTDEKEDWIEGLLSTSDVADPVVEPIEESLEKKEDF